MNISIWIYVLSSLQFIKSDRRAASLNATTATNTSFENQKNPGCEMCSNYEAQLVQEQKMTKEMETKVANAVKAAERHKEELLKEIGFRKDMEEKWNEKNEEHKKQVTTKLLVFILFSQNFYYLNFTN